MTLKTLASIIKEVEEAKTDSQKVKLLQKNSSASLKLLLGYALDKAVYWLLPPGEPPYRPLPKSADQEGKLYSECRSLIYLIGSPEGKALTQTKREQVFLQILESIDPDDAKLLLRVKDKKINIPVSVVKKAFPILTKDWE